MFSIDDSGFKKHMLIITIVLLELLSIGIILAATNNALHTITNNLNLDYPIHLDNISDTLIMRTMVAFVFIRSWYHYVVIDQINDTYEQNRALIQKIKGAIVHITIFIIIYFISDYTMLIHIINFLSETLTQ